MIAKISRQQCCGNFMKIISLILGVLVGLTIPTPAQTAREQIGLGASGSTIPPSSGSGFAPSPSKQAQLTKFCKVNGQIYQTDQLPYKQGIVAFKNEGVVILSFFDRNALTGETTPNGKMFALTNYPGEAVTDRLISATHAKKVGTFDWGSQPLELFDCGTPYIPPPPTPEEIAAAKAAQDKASADAKAKATAQKQAGAARALQANQDAAAKGDSFGLLRMGERYRDGDGVEKDLAKAKEYLQKAADAGSPTATEELAKLKP